MVLTMKKPRIGQSIMVEGLAYAYYMATQDKKKADDLKAKFEKERQWVKVFEVKTQEGLFYSIYHRDGTMDHARQPFGKTRPKAVQSLEQAVKERDHPEKKVRTPREPKAPGQPKEPKPQTTDEEKLRIHREKKLLRRQNLRAEFATYKKEGGQFTFKGWRQARSELRKEAKGAEE
jgi:hypothetical protein